MRTTRRWRWAVLAGALAGLMWAGCGDEEAPIAPFDDGPTGGQATDAGFSGDLDAGPDLRPVQPGEDSGVVLPPGADLDAGTDGGTDAGTDGGVGTVVPTLDGWRFYSMAEGAPADVRGVSEDASGNVWVAGGTEGLFVLRAGAERFERFGKEDGLRPFGFLPDGSAPSGSESIALEVLSVSGGPANTVFVGYAGHADCESNFDSATPDPAIYKSGDADRVKLTATGLEVVHYDIFSGPGVVGGYTNPDGSPREREKLCSILRLAYDPGTKSVWFGGNHGFAWGKAEFNGDPTCNGQLRCTGVFEHVHPHIGAKDAAGNVIILTDEYRGVAPAPNGDVWFGGANRSTRFRFTSNAAGPGNYFQAQLETEAPEARGNRVDVWPDAVDETQYPTPSQRKEDLVTAMAAMPDGSVWVASAAWGLAHVGAGGAVLGYALSGADDRNLSALGRDPRDDSLWVGHRYGGGVTRVKGGSVERLGMALGELAQHPVWDIQAAGSGGGRRLWVAFGSLAGRPGVVGVYRGP